MDVPDLGEEAEPQLPGGDHGFQVTDILVVIDRQLQRKKDGPTLQDEFGLKLHALITMDEIVAHMVRQNAITDTQLRDLARDYRRFERWDLPEFAA